MLETAETLKSKAWRWHSICATLVLSTSVFGGPVSESTQKPSLVVQYSHSESIVTVAISDNAERVASSDQTGMTLVWDLATGKQIARHDTTDGYVNALTFSKNGAVLVLVSGKGMRGSGSTISTWLIDEDRELNRFHVSCATVVGLALTKDGTELTGICIGEIDEEPPAEARIVRWSQPSGSPTSSISIAIGRVEEPQPGMKLIDEPSAKIIQINDRESLVAVWPRTLICGENKCAEQRTFSKSRVLDPREVEFERSGRMIYVCGNASLKRRRENVAYEELWSVAEGRLLWRHVIKGACGDTHISPGGEFVGVKFDSLKLYVGKTGRAIRDVELASEFAFSPDGRRLVLALEPPILKLGVDEPVNRRLQIQDALGPAPLRELKGYVRPLLAQARLGINVVVGVDQSAQRREHSTRRLPDDPSDNPAEHRVGPASPGFGMARSAAAPYRGLAFSPDDAELLVGEKNFAIKRWNLGSFETSLLDGRKFLKEDSTLDLGRDIFDVRGISFDKTGQTLVAHSAAFSVIWSFPQGTGLFSIGEQPWLAWQWMEAREMPMATQQSILSSIERLKRIDDDRNVVVTASKAGRFAAAGRDDGLVIVASQDSRMNVRLDSGGDYVSQLLISSDEKLIASVSDSTKLVIWRTLDWMSVSVASIDAEISALEFLDSSHVMVGCVDGSITKIDTKTGESIAHLRSDATGVAGLSISHDKRHLAVAAVGGAVQIFSVLTNELLVTLLDTGPVDGLAVAPNGDYVGTRGGQRAIAWRYQSRAFSFDEFGFEQNRPDNLMERVGRSRPEVVAALRAALSRIHGPDPSNRAPDTRPVVSLRLDEQFTTRKDAIDLRIDVTANGAPLDRLLIEVNEVLWRSEPIDGASLTLTVPVRLSAGLNQIRAWATLNSGARSVAATAMVTSSAAKKPGRLFILAVGSSSGVGDDESPRNTATDATLVASIFEKARSHSATTRLVLTGPAATRNEILKSAALLAQADVDDQVVVFFSGHGRLIGNQYHFVTQDEDEDSDGMDIGAIEAILAASPSRQKLLLIDSCFSGPAGHEALDGTAASNTAAALMANYLAELVRGSGGVVLASAGLSERAKSGNGPSLFVQAVQEALAGAADRDGDGLITTAELGSFVSGVVAERSGGSQRPISRRDQVDFDFSVSERTKKRATSSEAKIGR